MRLIDTKDQHDPGQRGYYNVKYKRTDALKIIKYNCLNSKREIY